MSNTIYIDPQGMRRFFGSAVPLFVGLLILVIASTAFHIVPAGHRGVKFSAISGVSEMNFEEGFHFKIPLIEHFIDMDVRIDKVEHRTPSASKDLQSVSTTVALNVRPDPDKAPYIYKNIGLNYRERIIDPAIQEAIKAVTARFTAEELIAARENVRREIQEILTLRLKEADIIVTAVNITDFKFSEAFDLAIESKQQAEQLALKATRDLDRIKVEAEQRVTQAKAEAEAQRLLRQSINNDIIELRRIDRDMAMIAKWNGTPPQVIGNGTPLINLR
jgi:regulator of protease activity HflC (stomatin/prohibitin superfamily)